MLPVFPLDSSQSPVCLLWATLGGRCPSSPQQLRWEVLLMALTARAAVEEGVLGPASVPRHVLQLPGGHYITCQCSGRVRLGSCM